MGLLQIICNKFIVWFGGNEHNSGIEFLNCKTFFFSVLILPQGTIKNRKIYRKGKIFFA